jgi:hypothetical protein
VTTVDPRHWSDARTAADKIVGSGASPDVIRAVLAQWICESGWTYPPKRNNPGNLAYGWAMSAGYPFKIYGRGPIPSWAGISWSGPDPYRTTGTNPQEWDGDPNHSFSPIVTFADEPTGVAAYAKGFETIHKPDGSLKYAKAIAAAKAGDGYTFVREALAEGYGTALSCFDSVNSTLIPTQPFDDDWGDTMFSTGGHIPQTDYRYPISNGTALYADPSCTKYVKSFSGTGGLARVIGPGKGTWDDATWPSAIVIIGTSALDPKGTGLYIRADKAQLVDTRTAAATQRFGFFAESLPHPSGDVDTL